MSLWVYECFPKNTGLKRTWVGSQNQGKNGFRAGPTESLRSRICDLPLPPGAAIMLTPVTGLYKTSRFKFWKRDQLALLQSGVYLLTHPSHIVRFSLWLPTPCSGTFLVKGDVLWMGATTLVGVHYNECSPPRPKEISNKQYKEKLYSRLSEAITLSSGKKLQDQRGVGGRNHQPVIFWYLWCNLFLHAYLAF